MRAVETFWYRLRPAHLLLFPLSLLFGAAIAVRRALFRLGILHTEALPVPVIVVGNIAVGGTGKTPLVLWLAERLTEQGYQPGIVTRGYGGNQRTQEVGVDSDPMVSGDEALLLARRSGCPVWTGRNRVAAAKALLARHPNCDVLVSDDGLQHYRLGRDVEIAVVDAARQLGNGLLLPAGPLREPKRRLQSVDAVVVNGEGPPNAQGPRQFRMRLQGHTLRNILNPTREATGKEFADRTVHAVAGIGNPARFFDHLRGLGMAIVAHAFPDHYAFEADDLAFTKSDTVVMTEKDAVKCEAFARESWWFLPVWAEVDPALADSVQAAIEARHGRKAAGYSGVPGNQRAAHL